MNAAGWIALAVISGGGGISCGRGKARPEISNHRSDVTRWVGRYACQIEQNGYRYSLYQCDIRSDHGRLRLTKLEGQMRFDGEIVPDAEGGFTWRGDVTCTYDDGCRGSVTAGFIAIEGGGGWESQIGPHDMRGGGTMSPMVVTIISESAASAAGGVRYGNYGDGGWNGGGYVGEVPVQ
jgi:hypothetical protein